jgi:hypothetical protein
MSGQDEEQFDVSSFSRLGWWGAAAIASLLVAVAAIRSDAGSRRLAAAFNGTPQKQAAKTAPPDTETRRLTETVRDLADDRDRLFARVTLLERNVEDVTGSVNARAAIDMKGPILPSGPSFMSTVTAPKTIDSFPVNRVASSPAAADDSAPAPQSTATITRFGIDIGGGHSVESLRDLWKSAKAAHTRLFETLRPVIAVRDVKPGKAELRLVIGPLPDASDAAKLCAALAAKGWTCSTAVFDGQRLALR